MTGHGVRRRRTDTATSDEDSSSSLPTPPDGGWGWIVVFGSFMIHVIADGVTYTFGIFFVELTEYYNSGKGATSWIASILVGLTLGAGPLASALTNKYGCRAVTIGGAVLASIGLTSSIFATDITMQYLCIGVCAGLGFGLMYLPAIVSVTCYFEKYRAFATGIAVCGSGVGTFVLAPFIKILIDSYTWKGAMLIVSGLVLNCAVFGALFRPVQPRKKPKSPPVDGGAVAEKEALMNGIPPKLKAELTVPQFHQVNLSNGHTNELPDGLRMSLSAHNLTNQQRQQQMVSLGSHQSLMTQPGDKEIVPSGIMYRKDIFYSGSLLNLPQYRSNPQMYTMSITHIPKGYSSMKDSFLANCCNCSKETRDAWVEMMDLSLFKDPIFVLFAISNFCTSIGFNVPYVYIKDRALLNGISDYDSTTLISVIGIANTVSRVILGYVSDKPWLNRLWLYNSALTICGLSTMMSAFCLDFYSTAVYAAIFGATAGAYVGLTSVILVDLLGLEKLTNAFGLLLLFQGIASLVGPPIAGSLYDALQSYDPGFHVAGSMIAASGLMLFLIPCIRRLMVWQQTKHKNASSAHTIPEMTVANANDVESAI